MNIHSKRFSKRTIFLLIFIAFSLLAANNIARATETTTVVLNVPGMTCKFCPITIRKALNNVEGVVTTKSEFETKTATVTFDPIKTNVGALMKATANAGYPSTIKK